MQSKAQGQARKYSRSTMAYRPIPAQFSESRWTRLGFDVLFILGPLLSLYLFWMVPFTGDMVEGLHLVMEDGAIVLASVVLVLSTTARLLSSDRHAEQSGTLLLAFAHVLFFLPAFYFLASNDAVSFDVEISARTWNADVLVSILSLGLASYISVQSSRA